MKPINDFITSLQTPHKLVITTHYKPDADAIGSSLGLYHYLVQLGHSVQIISPSEVPDFLQWMPGVTTILNYENDSKGSELALQACDYIICLDFNHPSRVRTLEAQLVAATQPKVLIDHHLEPLSSFFAYGISQPEKSSTCEMIYDFICSANGQEAINEPIMQCLYAGCMTDTGSFRFPATTASVHEMIAFFKHKGLKHAKIHEEIYDNFHPNRLKLIGQVLNTIYLNEEEHFAIMFLSLADAQKFAVAGGDTEGIVNYGLSVKNIGVSFFLTERAKGEVRISLRSKGQIDVSKFARDYFNGGGHMNASGGISHDGLPATIDKIKSLMKSTGLAKNYPNQ